MNRHLIRLTLVTLTSAIAGSGNAADSDRFVVRGAAANQLLEQNTINIDTAEKIGKTCIDLATKQGVKVTVAIYDQFGEMVWFYRMDGQSKNAVEGAILKAKTVLSTRQSSKVAMNALVQGRTTELRQINQYGGVAVGGGLPILINNNQFIGAIGVGGSPFMPPAWSDELCAWKAMTAVMGPQPPLVADLPRNNPPPANAPAR